LDFIHRDGEAFQDQLPDEILQQGSGWGALESLYRERAGQAAFSTAGMVFDKESLTTEQAPWISLVNLGVMPDVDPDSVPVAFMTQDEWKARLEAFVKSGQRANWFAWLQLGVMRFTINDRDGARRAWEQSLQHTPTAWAKRNLAVLAIEEGQQEEAVKLYIEAVRMKPALLPLAVECGQALLQSMQPQKWLELLKQLPMVVRSSGRIQLLEAQAALAIGDFRKVEQFFEDEVIVPTIREGELSLSDFWFEYHLRRLSSQENCQIDEALRARVYREYPVPAHIDFRMRIEPHEQAGSLGEANKQ
jgi:tetratricopeptide (TPR) repeat protein